MSATSIPLRPLDRADPLPLPAQVAAQVAEPSAISAPPAIIKTGS